MDPATLVTTCNPKEWRESLGDIISMVTEYQKACTMLTQMHESLLVSLKKTQDKASVAIRYKE